MFGLFKPKPPSKPVKPFADHPHTDSGPRRMTLEERKQVRREMVYQSVRENLPLLGITPSMYKFKAVGLDERQHRFMLVVDVASGFIAKRDGSVMRLNEVEEFLSERTFVQFGVRIDAIYWRFHPETSNFVRGSRPGDGPAARPKPKPELAPASGIPIQPLARQPASSNEPVSPEEIQALGQAIACGAKPPPLRPGDLEYQSDQVPLEPQPVVGGTQYGAL